ncbi:hypothetical protein ACFU5Y_16420, partial [Streptomyces gardneri]|uniref:hypothetical protein n=1 Tax=Streptomyces gardneri TaxID=66892 RepID=UPI00368E8021
MALPSGRVRQAARETHHGPFPDAPELLARAVRADAHGVRARYLFASAEAAAGFSAAGDPALTRLGTALTGPPLAHGGGRTRVRAPLRGRRQGRR